MSDTEPTRASQRPTDPSFDPEETLQSPPSSALRPAPLPLWLRDRTGAEHLCLAETWDPVVGGCPR